jgi:transcriptional regulator with XRE-family HTH domain
MKDQLNKLMEAEGLSPAKFADEIGVQRSSISHILSGRNKPSYDFLIKILNRFKGINAEWLLTGKGNMIKGLEYANEEDSQKNNLFEQKDQKGNKNKASSVFNQPQINWQNEDDLSITKPENTEEFKSQIKPGENVFTNVNNAQYILVFYKNGTFEQFNPRK